VSQKQVQNDGETGRAKRLSPLPTRSFEMGPGGGGPFADRLGKIDRHVLAEIERGGAGDRGVGSRR